MSGLAVLGICVALALALVVTAWAWMAIASAMLDIAADGEFAGMHFDI